MRRRKLGLGRERWERAPRSRPFTTLVPLPVVAVAMSCAEGTGDQTGYIWSDTGVLASFTVLPSTQLGGLTVPDHDNAARRREHRRLRRPAGPKSHEAGGRS